MNIITITSDWSSEDYYLSTVKGKILCEDPDSRFVDISNSVSPLDVMQGMFVLRHSFSHFPEGTIHLLAVASEPTSLHPMVIFRAFGHFFVGINDGRFVHLFDNEDGTISDDFPVEAFALPLPDTFSTFMAAEQFAQAVKIINQNSFVRDTQKCELQKEVLLRPLCNESSIIGKVIYIDSFGNAVTNISKNLLAKMIDGREYEILVQGPYAKIAEISRDYTSVPQGELVAVFNSLGYLEIAINQGNAAEVEGLYPSSEIAIRFMEDDTFKLI